MDNEPNQPKSLTIHKTFKVKASPEAVWKAWTTPEQLSQWYAPAPFTIPVCELDPSVGGQLRIDMQSPDGTRYPSSGEYKEVTEPTRLVFTNSPLDANGNSLFTVQHSLTLISSGDGTDVELVSEVLSAGPEAAPFLAGMEAGLVQAIAQLEQMVTA